MSDVRRHDGSSGAAEAAAAAARPRAVLAPGADRAAFTRALLHAAQRRSGEDDRRDAPGNVADAPEALHCTADAAIAALCTGTVVAALPDRVHATPLSAPPCASARAARPPARAGSRQAPPQDDNAVQESPTTIEWQSTLLPSGRLTVSRSEGGAWTLHCHAADLDALRSAIAQLADRFEQHALGPPQIRVD
jgi:hypothetical protein